MDIEWQDVTGHVIRALDFYIRGLEFVSRPGDPACKQSYDVINLPAAYCLLPTGSTDLPPDS
jgi:hypothetical protein